MNHKNKIRAQILRKLRDLSSREKSRRDSVLKKKLFRLEIFRKARYLCLYVSLLREVDTTRIIDRVLKDHKKVFIPLTNLKENRIEFYAIKSRKELTPGVLGILEPAARKSRRLDLRKLDLVIAPGVAFDKEGYRLGRGGGFYDRFLEKLKGRVPVVALAYDFQVLEKIPHEKHDQKVNIVITA